jgi:hypothetical protein
VTKLQKKSQINKVYLTFFILFRNLTYRLLM